MGFTNISSFSPVPPCEFIEEVLKESKDGDKIVVSYSRCPYVSKPLPRYDAFSVENCQAAGISLDAVSPYVIDGMVDPVIVDKLLDDIVGPESSGSDDVSNE